MSMDTGSHNVTITILDTSLSLVHIPRSRLTELNRPILKQLLRKSPKFLNLTANEIELSIFAEDDELADFEPIARRDRQKQRQRDRADSVSTPAGHRRRRPSHSVDAQDPVEISIEKWRVLQIDSHDDSLSDSGSRVRELSAPLAAAGISILYQSSYLSDFIFVKDFRLEEVMKLLGAEGFTLYDTDSYDLSVSSPPPPGTPDYFNERAFSHLQDGHPGSPGAMTPAILSRTRSPSSASLALSRPGAFEDLTASTLMMMHKSKLSSSPMSSSATSRASRTPKKSLSPTAAPVEVLGPDLACVGLNDSSADVWSVKILTLVGYPELIPTPSVESTSFYHFDEKRDSLADSLYGSMPKVHTGTLSSPVTGPLSPSDVFSHELDVSDAEKGLDDDVVDSEPRSSRGSSSPEDNLSSCSSSDVDDEYFSSSSPYKRRTGSGSTPSLVSGTSQSSARSLPERLDSIHKSERPRLSQLTTSQAESSRAPRSRTNSSSKPTSTAPLRVPFFSFTRTAEGSSLTTDLGVLSALFGLDERHMVICSGTLLDAGDEINARAAVEEQFGASARARRQVFDLDVNDIFEMEEEQEPAPGTMKCLQIDLQKFGLDKYGLVNRFSRVLEEHGINHMYSSTYKTANLLVDKAHAVRAQSLLRSC